MRVIIPMSGRGARFREAGYTTPKPLIEVDGRPIIAHLLEQFPADWPKVFVCNRDHVAQTPIRSVLERLAPGCTVIGIEPHDKGPVHAVLQAAEVLPDEEPCLVNYCDFSFSWDPARFEAFTRRTGCDGAVVGYTGYHPEYLRPTLYAYCRHEDGRLLEIKEKGHFTGDRTSELASSGTYYFKSGALLRHYFARLMAEGPLLNGEGYVSLVFQHLLRDGLHVRVFEIPWFLQWGTPEDLHDYDYWSRTFSGYYRQARKPLPMQLLMPMAGQGTRFGAGLPKFLRPMGGRPMFQAAIDRLPATTSQTLVVRSEHVERVKAAAPGARIVSLPSATDGQAVTCARAADALELSKPVLVSSCDHGLVWDDARWGEAQAGDSDVVVFGQRHYPGADVTPNAFAYIATDGDRITRVSVKEPLSRSPRRDLLLTGTFYFRSAALLMDLIAELRAKDLRVNGELYVDSVVNLAVGRGLQVRAFETDGYLCWGTPEAVREFNWWHDWFNGRTAPRSVVGA
jgi:NDP-sugar pyrophosphorylase family protein